MRRALNATCHTQCAEVYRPALNLASSCRELPRSKLTEGSYAHRIRSWRGGNSPAAKINPLVGPLFRGWGVELLDRDSSVSGFWGCRGRIKQRRVPGPDRDVESSSIEVPSWAPGNPVSVWLWRRTCSGLVSQVALHPTVR